MNKTIWIRPSGFGAWLVATAEVQKKTIDDVFADYKNVQENFEEALQNTNLEYRKFNKENFDYEKYDNFIVKSYMGNEYEEEIEFMLVDMTDKQIENLEEFIGW